MVLGTAFHAYLLEGDAFPMNFTVMPKFDRRTIDPAIKS